MTFTILEDILKEYPHVIGNGVIVIRTDNCPAQYKSKYVFQKMKNMAKAHNISIYWFYGEPGHGHGVVDAMSSFGCKTALRCAIVIGGLVMQKK